MNWRQDKYSVFNFSSTAQLKYLPAASRHTLLPLWRTAVTAVLNLEEGSYGGRLLQTMTNRIQACRTEALDYTSSAVDSWHIKTRFGLLECAVSCCASHTKLPQVTSLRWQGAAELWKRPSPSSRRSAWWFHLQTWACRQSCPPLSLWRPV